MLVKTYGGCVHGVNATTITIEVNIDSGVAFFLVGLPDNAVKESHQRIEAALKNIGHKIPGKKITINMALCNGVACRRCERACSEKSFDLISLLTC